MEGNLRSVLLGRTVADDLDRFIRLANLITLTVDLSVLVYLNGKLRGKGIYNRCSHSVETAGYLISAAAKLSTGMKHRVYNLQCRLSGFVIHPDRDTTPVIFHRNRIIRIDRHFNILTISRKRLIYCIIYNLIYQMMKSSRRCTSNVHSGSFSDCLKSL